MLTSATLLETFQQLPLFETERQAQLVTWLESVSHPPAQIIETLKARDWLTEYQATQILAGRAQELILNDTYLLLDVMGEGGMGQVFRAKHLTLEQIRAVKTIRREFVGSSMALQRFRREMKLAAQLDHPNVVRVYDAGQAHGMHYFVMELVQGSDLSDVIAAQGRLPIPLAAEYVRQSALGLQHAYEKGLIHRDIKPSNLLLTDQGVVKILDLGLARAVEAEGESLVTQTGQLMGTPDFIAPEQTVNAKAVDIRADIYSLGCTLYQLLTGKVPFPGGSIPAKLLRHCKKNPAPAEKLRSDVPPGLVEVLNRMIAKKPERRQQTPQEVVDGLSPFCGGAKGVLSAPRQAPQPETLLTRGAATAHPATAKKDHPEPTTTPVAPTLGTRHGSSPRAVTAVPVRKAETIPPKPEIITQTARSKKAPPTNPASLREKKGDPPHQANARKRGRFLKIGLGVGSLLGVVVAVYFSVASGSEETKTNAQTGHSDKPQPPSRKQFSVLPLQEVILSPGDHRQIQVQVKRESFQGPIELRLERLPQGVKAKTGLVPSGADVGQIALTVDASAQGKRHEIRLIAISAGHRGEQTLSIVLKPVESVITNSIGMKLRLIPAGKFLMGSPPNEQNRDADEGPQHEVEITRPFYLGVYEVTQEEYRKVMGTSPSSFREGGMRFQRVQGLDTARFPVETVSWNDAVEFCRRLSALSAERSAKRTYRLPTEAEWEYACRGGSKAYQAVAFGNSLSSREANFKGDDPYGGATRGPNLSRTTQVGSYKPNGFGLHDMHGNVWEWCSDRYDADYYQNSPKQDPKGPSGQTFTQRCIRGGSWVDHGYFCRSASRNSLLPNDRNINFGFRVVCASPDSSDGNDPPKPPKDELVFDTDFTNPDERPFKWLFGEKEQGIENGHYVMKATPGGEENVLGTIRTDLVHFSCEVKFRLTSRKPGDCWFGMDLIGDQPKKDQISWLYLWVDDAGVPFVRRSDYRAPLEPKKLIKDQTFELEPGPVRFRKGEWNTVVAKVSSGTITFVVNGKICKAITLAESDYVAKPKTLRLRLHRSAEKGEGKVEFDYVRVWRHNRP